ncbi:MAG: DUF116 domain-containing protein [Planctomycetota bacterium]|jgi:hypothetical protein
MRVVRLFNGMTRLRRARCRPGELLVLIPSCLQSSECCQRITIDVGECRRCGRCKVKDIIELSERHGARCVVATGGRLALELAGDDRVGAVVAVACEKELQEGMKAVFPKAALGVLNIRSHGPCRDTDVNLDEVEEAINWLLRD